MSFLRLSTILLVTASLSAGAVGVTWAAFSARTTNPNSSFTTAAVYGCDYRNLVIGTTGVRNYWRLDETPGNSSPTDLVGPSGGSYVGTHTLGVAGGIFGDPNTAVRLGGGYLDLGDQADFVGAAGFTIEAWIRPTTTDLVYRRILSKARLEGLGRQGYEFWVQSVSGFGFERFRDGLKDEVTAALPALNVWSHAVATYDGSTMRLYLNGSLVGSVASARSLTDNGAPLRIGTSSEAIADNWLGDLDDVAIYNGALTGTQVEDHFRCGRRYRNAVLDTAGLQSYWRLGEPSGLTAFDTKGTVNGTYQNGITLGAAGALTDGTKAASFDGDDDIVEFGDFYDFASTASFTVEGWINRTTAGEADEWRWIVAKESVVDPRDGWSVLVAPDLHVSAPQSLIFSRWSAGTSNVVTSTTLTVPNTWYHFAATYDGANMRIYVNGSLQATTPSTLSMPNTTLPLRLGGAAPPSTNRFAGRMDEIAVYNTALNAAQIADHYAWR